MTPTQALQEMFALTERQSEVLGTIIDYRRRHGYSPTTRELGDLIGCRSPNATLQIVNALVRKRALTKEHYGARSLVPQVKFLRREVQP